jgi:hypothetical protein
VPKAGAKDSDQQSESKKKSQPGQKAQPRSAKAKRETELEEMLPLKGDGSRGVGRVEGF